MIFVEWKTCAYVVLTTASLFFGTWLIRRGVTNNLLRLVARLGGVVAFLLAIPTGFVALVILFSSRNSVPVYSPDHAYAARTSTFLPFLGSGVTVVELFSAHGFRHEIVYDGLEESVLPDDLIWLDDRTLLVQFDPTSNEDHGCCGARRINIIGRPKS